MEKINMFWIGIIGAFVSGLLVGGFLAYRYIMNVIKDSVGWF